MSEFEVVCSTDHSSTGGAAPGFVVARHETESKAEKSILILRGIYPRCDLGVQACESADPSREKK